MLSESHQSRSLPCWTKLVRPSIADFGIPGDRNFAPVGRSTITTTTTTTTTRDKEKEGAKKLHKAEQLTRGT